jgi:DNA-binding GntR family transcriptional regulator
MAKPVLKTSRVSDAYAQLKSEIRANRMPPGFQATEPEIALHLGMSRTPVREALIRLAADGLVELIPRRGARVLPINSSDMREIYDILTALEPDAAAAFALTKPTNETLVPLEAATQDMELALATEDLDAWAEADDRFHTMLLDLQGNQRLTRIVTALCDQAHRARMLTLRMRELPRKSTQEHRTILEHLRAGDADAVRKAFRQHRQRAAVEILVVLDTYKLGQL